MGVTTLYNVYQGMRMGRLSSTPNFTDCLTISEAAQFLGVSTATLRNWDRSGKLRPRRHPQNGYRIYLHEDLQAVLRSAELTVDADSLIAPRVDWTDMRDREHFVQFYETDAYLVDSVSGFVNAALAKGDASVVIATMDHRLALQRKLVSWGTNVAEAIEAGRYVVLDAADMLGKFMIEGLPDQQQFNETIGGVMAQLSEGGRRVHAFGEMVALLWADGNSEAAIRLEELWNELGKSHRFALLCAYPIAGFDQQDHSAPFGGICDCHTRVIPAESYGTLDDANERLRAISQLQQKAQSLEAEIAHRREVEESLRKRERELADFFENATEGLHKVGPDGTILWANKAECDLLGYSLEEYVGRSIVEFHVDSELITDLLKKLNHGETLVNHPARLRCKDGSTKQVLISSNAFFEDGEFVHTRCFTRDVSQQWEAEQSLLEADRRKDVFLATLAHELRNPLAPIRNALTLLTVPAPTQAVTEEARDVIKRQVEQMTRLVDDLLDVSRITRDKIDLRKERVELASVIGSAVETSQPLIDSAKQTLSISLPDEPVYFHADPTRMAQVFANLLQNAAKYSEQGGQIQIQAEVSGAEVVVRVRDEGIGISCEALAYVFDMFRQVDGSLERAQGGLGIGLTLVRRLVELHGGTVNAQSDGPGTGSEFIVRMPIVAERAQETAATAPAAVLAKQRILVVDDNKDSGDTLSALLRLKGHDVRTARDGLEALDVVGEFQPQIILMDVGMPKMNGYEATRRIRQSPNGKETFIVALTGWGQADDVQRSAEAGCSAHLVKPVDLDVLERLLARGAASTA
jgi:PAS domain S-box-containing protein